MNALRRFAPDIKPDGSAVRHTPGSSAALGGLVAMAETAIEAGGEDLGIDLPTDDIFFRAPSPGRRPTRERRGRHPATRAAPPRFPPESLDWLFNPSDDGG